MLKRQCPLRVTSRLHGHCVDTSALRAEADVIGGKADVEHWSLTTLREKLIKIGAKVGRHGRYITFQLAEVAIPRSLFANILRLIDGLRPAPLPP